MPTAKELIELAKKSVVESEANLSSASTDLTNALKELEGPPTPPTVTSIQITVHGPLAEVIAAPAGTVTVHWAYMKNIAGEGLAYKDQPVGPFTPPAGFPVVDAIAFNSTGTPIGNWAGRVATESAPAPPTPPIPPPPPATGCIIGTNDFDGWGPNSVKTLLAGGIHGARGNLSEAEAAIKAGADPARSIVIVGNVSDSQALSSVNNTSWASGVKGEVEKAKALGVTRVELGNEMYGKPSSVGGWPHKEGRKYGEMCLAALTACKGLGVRLLMNAPPVNGQNFGWLEEMAAAPGLTGASTGFTWHPYPIPAGVAPAIATMNVQIAKAKALGFNAYFEVTEWGIVLGSKTQGAEAANETDRDRLIKQGFTELIAAGAQALYYFQSHASEGSNWGLMDGSDNPYPALAVVASFA